MRIIVTRVIISILLIKMKSQITDFSIFNIVSIIVLVYFAFNLLIFLYILPIRFKHTISGGTFSAGKLLNN